MSSSVTELYLITIFRVFFLNVGILCRLLSLNKSFGLINLKKCSFSKLILTRITVSETVSALYYIHVRCRSRIHTFTARYKNFTTYQVENLGVFRL